MSVNTSVGSPGTVSAASGGLIYAYNNISTTPQSILGVGAERVSITFHNPGSVDVFIAPLFTQAGGSDTALVPSTAALGGCYLVFANGGQLKIEGECQKGWQAFSRSGTGNPLTVMVSRI